MTHTNVPTPAGLLDLVGAPLGVTTWHEITQQRVNLFADATDDHQWIHTDPARAAAGPFGTTIAHGYLTLALAPLLIAEAVSVDNVAAVLNYGLNKVRFPAPMPVGGRPGLRTRRCHPARLRRRSRRAVPMTTIPEDGQLVRIGGHQLQVHIRPGHTGTTPLLVCGGIGTSYQALQPLVDAIDSSIEIIRVDVPGVGGSPPAPLPLGFPYLAWLLGQLLDDLGYRQVDVLG